MDVDLPVFLYDVTTTAAPPRFVVSCRTPAAAQDLALRLNRLQADDVLADATEVFMAAEPRLAVVTLKVTKGGSVTVQGYEVATEVVATALNDAKGVKTPPPDAVDPAALDTIPSKGAK